MFWVPVLESSIVRTFAAMLTVSGAHSDICFTSRAAAHQLRSSYDMTLEMRDRVALYHRVPDRFLRMPSSAHKVLDTNPPSWLQSVQHDHATSRSCIGHLHSTLTFMCVYGTLVVRCIPATSRQCAP